MFPDQFAAMVSQLRGILPVVHRTLNLEPAKGRTAADSKAARP
jgi:hypothetical protein